jgi:hypothetical protein
MLQPYRLSDYTFFERFRVDFEKSSHIIGSGRRARAMLARAGRASLGGSTISIRHENNASFFLQ